MNIKLIGSAIVGILALLFLVSFSPLTSVSNGHIGIVTVGGEARSQVLTPGYHLITPFGHVNEISVQPLKDTASGEAASKDIQAVHTEMAVNYQLNADKAVWFFTKVGEHGFQDRILKSAAQDAFKAATSKYRAEELISQREQVRKDTKQNLVKSIDELTGGSVTVIDVFFTNFAFNKGFSDAIEAAVTAEKQALAEKNKRDIKKYEGEQNVITAQAAAQVMALTRQQATPEYLKLKELEVEMARVEKWDGKLPDHLYSGAGTPTSFMNVGK